jgi:hypothetical protein
MARANTGFMEPLRTYVARALTQSSRGLTQSFAKWSSEHFPQGLKPTPIFVPPYGGAEAPPLQSRSGELTSGVFPVGGAVSLMGYDRRYEDAARAGRNRHRRRD